MVTGFRTYSEATVYRTSLLMWYVSHNKEENHRWFPVHLLSLFPAMVFMDLDGSVHLVLKEKGNLSLGSSPNTHEAFIQGHLPWCFSCLVLPCCTFPLGIPHNHSSKNLCGITNLHGPFQWKTLWLNERWMPWTSPEDGISRVAKPKQYTGNTSVYWDVHPVILGQGHWGKSTSFYLPSMLQVISMQISNKYTHYDAYVYYSWFC